MPVAMEDTDSEVEYSPTEGEDEAGRMTLPMADQGTSRECEEQGPDEDELSNKRQRLAAIHEIFGVSGKGPVKTLVEEIESLMPKKAVNHRQRRTAKQQE